MKKYKCIVILILKCMYMFFNNVRKLYIDFINLKISILCNICFMDIMF